MSNEFDNDVVWPSDEMELEERRQLFGKILQQYRERAGISQVGLAQATRISLSFLEALESGEIEKLPGDVFGRGFLRSICSTIGADAAPLLAAYDLCLKKDTLPAATKKPIRKKEPKTRTSVQWRQMVTMIPRPRWEIIAPAAIVIGAIVASVYMDQLEEDKPTVAASLVEKSKPTPKIEAPRSLPPEVPSTDASLSKLEKVAPVPESDSVDLEPPKPIPELKVAAKPVRADQVLEIKATADLRIKIKLDDKQTVIRELKPDTYRFRFEEAAEVLIYDAGSADVIFNGRDLGPIGKKGRLRKFSFEAKPGPEAF